MGNFFKQAFRGLRVRLTLGYLLIFSIVLVSIGILFRQVLEVIVDQQMSRRLDSNWTEIQSFISIENGAVVWKFDPANLAQVRRIERLRRIFLIAAGDGRILEMSAEYAGLGREPLDQIRRLVDTAETTTVVRRNAAGESFVIRMGGVRVDGKAQFLAVGVSAGILYGLPGRAAGVYFTTVPIMLIAIAVLGWFATGRALMPLREATQAVQAMAHGNLGSRIRAPGSGDELDTLITSFNEMAERLERNFNHIRQFSLDASHELRTPLTALRGQLEVALFTAKNQDDYREAIITAMEDVERLGQIVKTLLLLAQAESGQIDLQKKAQNLSPVIEELVSYFRMASSDRQIAVNADLPKECMAEVDRVQFERILQSLLSNAVKFSPAGGVISVMLNRTADSVVLSVSDNGPGIPKERQAEIFRRFYRIRDSGGDEGAGLGLAVALWATKAHGGTIEVQSEPGHGATFTITLPLGAYHLAPVNIHAVESAK